MATDFVTLGTGLITFVVGLVVGHKTNLSREKRKEWNELTAEQYRSLRIQVESQGKAGGLSGNDFHLIELYMGWFTRRRFRAALERYKRAASKARGPYQVETGSVPVYEEALPELVEAATVLLKFFRPR